MKKKIGFFGVMLYGSFYLLTLCLNGCLTTAGGQDAAKMLSAQVTLVAEKGKSVADGRDELAKARLRNMQMLENSLVETEEENSIDLHAWRVIGAEFRSDLFEGVMAATNDEANRHELRKQRRERQEKELAKRKSSVIFKQNELIDTAKGLASLSKKVNAREERARLLAFTEKVLADIQVDTTDGSTHAEDGKKIAEKVLENLVKLNEKDLDKFLKEITKK